MEGILVEIGVVAEGFRSIENKKNSYDDEQEQVKI
jgi:hypothetical protein